jgi:hypothetical protein
LAAPRCLIVSPAPHGSCQQRVPPKVAADVEHQRPTAVGLLATPTHLPHPHLRRTAREQLQRIYARARRLYAGRSDRHAGPMKSRAWPPPHIRHKATTASTVDQRPLDGLTRPLTLVSPAALRVPAMGCGCGGLPASPAPTKPPVHCQLAAGMECNRDRKGARLRQARLHKAQVCHLGADVPVGRTVSKGHQEVDARNQCLPHEHLDLRQRSGRVKCPIMHAK